MSVAVEHPQTHSVGNLQTTMTDLEMLKANEPEEDSQQTDDIAPNASTRGNSLSYTRDQCLTMKDAWLSNIRPAALSDRYCNREGVWDPEMWYYSPESEKRSASPIDNKNKYLLDGIVLSPQGRSFARGCQVNAGKPDGGVDVKNKLSGRPARGWPEPREKGWGRARNSPNADSQRRYERNYNSGNSGITRRRAASLELQPEWFTHGPASQHDTIELRGFDEAGKGNSQKKRRKSAEKIAGEQEARTPDAISDENRKFDINEFFDMAENALPISNIYDSQPSSSRFSQWFANDRRSRSNSLANSRRSSIADELAEIAGLALISPARSPTPERDFMFAPIIPAPDSCPQDDVLNIIQDSDVDVQPLLDSVIPHKTVKGAMTLEDLESTEGIASNTGEQSDHETQAKEESQVFLKLVETMKASGNLPAKPAPTIPDIPPHLLPRPPSSRDNNRATPGSRSRSPSPLQLLQEVIKRGQSPVTFANQLQTEASVMSSYDTFRGASPVPDILAPVARARPLTPEEIYGAPPVFGVDSGAPDLFEFTGSVANVDTRMSTIKRPFQSRYPANLPETTTNGVNAQDLSADKPSAVIAKAFVPTSVLRKYHCDKHDHQKTSHDTKKDPDSSSIVHNSNLVASTVSSGKQRDSYQASPTLMSPREFTSPKSTGETLPRPELMTPHRLPLPGSPCMTPHSLPLPQTPMVQNTPQTTSENSMIPSETPHSLPLPQSPMVLNSPKTSANTPLKPLLTPHSLPLPHSPSVANPGSNSTSDFGIRPLPKARGVRKQFEQRQTNPRRFPQGQFACRQVIPNMITRPGMLPTPFNMNAARAMNVHPTALALALRNQQYQMARAAAVAAATAAVNRPPTLSQAQAAAAAAMMLNQQRAAGRFRGIMPQANPRMFARTPQRPNLPPALQRQHHVVHHSDGHKKNDSLSKWFSDAVLNQSQFQPPPERGAKVLSVEELERHACV